MGFSVSGMRGLRSAVDRGNKELRALNRKLDRLIDLLEEDGE